MGSGHGSHTGCRAWEHSEGCAACFLRTYLYENCKAAGTFLLNVVIECVVRNVAVQNPFSWFSRRPNHIVTLTGTNVDHISLESSGKRQRDTVASHHGKRTTVHVHWMNEVVVRPDEAKPDCLSNLHPQSISRGICLAIDREIV